MYAASFLIILCTSGSSLFPVLDFQTSRFPQRNNMSFVTFSQDMGGGWWSWHAICGCFCDVKQGQGEVILIFRHLWLFFQIKGCFLWHKKGQGGGNFSILPFVATFPNRKEKTRREGEVILVYQSILSCANINYFYSFMNISQIDFQGLTFWVIHNIFWKKYSAK